MCFAIIIATALEIITAHNGIVIGRLKARSIPVITALPSNGDPRGIVLSERS